MKAISLFIFFLVSIQAFCQDRSSQIYNVAQEMPVYPGGEDSMWRFINSHVIYPDSAIAHNVEGKLVMGFVVNQDGSLSDVVIRRGLTADIDSEGMRVIRLLPRFTPGRQDGKAVRVSYTLPISFKLKPNPADTIKKTYKVVEHMPEFPGGDSARNHFIVTHINYPEYARDNEIQGKVVVDFIVNEDGSLSDFSVVEKVYPSLDAEALRLVKLMPKYIPGTQNGKPVKVHFKLPIGFKIVESSINPEPDYSDIPNVYSKVTIMPEYPGGRQQLIDFINTNIKYPKEAKDLRVQGTVIVSFIVDESGKLSHFWLEQTGYYVLNEEAMRLAKLLPTFTPGMQNGKPVKAIYTLPIRFKLNDWEYFDPFTKDTSVLNH